MKFCAVFRIFRQIGIIAYKSIRNVHFKKYLKSRLRSNGAVGYKALELESLNDLEELKADLISHD